MLGLKKSEKKVIYKLNTNLLLISKMGVFGSTNNHKRLRIRFNPNASLNKKSNSTKKLNNNSFEGDIGSTNFNLEIAKKIDNLLEENRKKDIIFSTDSTFQKGLEQPMQNIVEFRLPITKQPGISNLSDEEKNTFKETTFKEFYETKFPAEYYYRFKDPKNTSSTKNKTSDEPVKQEKTATSSTKAVPHIKIKKENILIDEELRKKHNGLSKKEEWAAKREEELKREQEKLKREKELLKKQEIEFKKEAKQKLKQKKLEEKQRKLEEKQKIKEEKQREKEEKIQELLLLKNIKEQEKRKKKEKQDDTSLTQTRTVEEKTDETVKDFDKLVLNKKENVKEKTFFDEDVEKIIPVIDSLLEKLPEKVIEDFVQSDDFALYEKVVSKYKKK